MNQKKLALLLLGIFLLLRLPSLFEPFTYGDEGIYLALGQASRQGSVFYRDIHDNKPPLLYLIAALTNNFTYYRLLFFIWSLGTIFLFYKLSQLIFPKNQKASFISTIIFTIITNLATFEGNIANAENFMMGLTIGAFYLILKKPKPLKTWLASGFLISLATLFKVPAAFDLVALALLAFFLVKEIQWKILLKRWLSLSVGFILPILLTFVYYASQKALLPYLKAAFFQNIPYLSSWAGNQTQAAGLPLGMLIRTGLIFGAIGLLFVYRKRVNLELKIIIPWFGFSLFAALLSSRPYPHYLLQILPALALSLGLFIKKQKTIPLALISILIFVFLFFKFWHYPNWPYYANFYQYSLGLKDKALYFQFFGNHTQDLYDTAEFINQRTQPKEKIFIWGTQPSIYPLSRRSPIGRYAVSYHIIDFNGYQETMIALKENPPYFVIVDKTEERPFPEFFSLLAQNYVLDTTFGNLHIFHRIL